MLNLNVIFFILMAAVLLDFVLGAVLYFAKRTAVANQLFALFTISLAIWTAMLIGFYTVDNNGIALYWMRGAYVAAIIAVIGFWYFATQFPHPTRLARFVHAANIISFIIYLSAVIFTPLIVVDITGYPRTDNVVINPIGWYLYAFYLLYYFLSGHIILFYKFLRSAGIERRQLKLVVLSVFIGGEIFGVFFNLILPSPIFNEWRFIWAGPVLTAAIITPVIARAITKHQLLNVKAVVTEIFVVFIVFLAFIDAFIFQSIFELVIRLIIALGILCFGFLLVKGMLNEIEQRKKLQEVSSELANANIHLKELDAQKNEFISIAAHELRTPMSVIKGYLSLMLEGMYGRLPKVAKQKTENIFFMNERLVHMINNLLNLSRIEKNRIDFDCAAADLSELIGQVVEDMRFKTKENNLQLAFFKPDKALPKVNVDQDKLREVFVNLIDNAIKYSTSGTIEVRVKPGAGSDAGMVVATVSDTGIGMNQELVGRLFEKFYRGNNPLALKKQGTGIGLFICNKFVSGMGGRIRVESTAPDKGTTFAVSLPVATPRKSAKK